jgi:dipeptidase
MKMSLNTSARTHHSLVGVARGQEAYELSQIANLTIGSSTNTFFQPYWQKITNVNQTSSKTARSVSKDVSRYKYFEYQVSTCLDLQLPTRELARQLFKKGIPLFGLFIEIQTLIKLNGKSRTCI